MAIADRTRPRETNGTVSLADILLAADRGLAPLGPEYAGYLALEAALSMTEDGVGAISADRVGIDEAGHVHVRRQRSGHVSEADGVVCLRALLQEMLGVATSSTPALRACARRRTGSLRAILRELEAALVPLNREASRRGLARLARSTFDALEGGLLDRQEGEPSPEPVAVAAIASQQVVRAPRVADSHIAPEPPVLLVETILPSEDELLEAMPTPIWTAPHPSAGQSTGQTADDDGEIEIVTSLPPLVAPVAAPIVTDVVAKPAAANPSSKLRFVQVMPDEVTPSELPPVAADADPAMGTRRAGRMLALSLFATLIAATGVAWLSGVKLPPAMAAWFTIDGPPSPVAAVVRPAAASATVPTRPAMVVAAACEANLTLDDIPNGTEVLRRIGTAPLAASIPTHVPLDLVVTLEGLSPRRVRIEASTLWQRESTGPRLPLSVSLEPLGLDAKTGKHVESPWPARVGVAAPLSAEAGNGVGRGLIQLTTTPLGASLWLSVEPRSIGLLPCGAPVDLLVISAARPKPIHIEWAAFSGSPPRAAHHFTP